MPNDYRYRDDPAKARDSRWVHRPFTDWDRMARRNHPATVEGRVYAGLRRLIALRKECPAFGGGEMVVPESGTPHVFGYVRQNDGARVLVLANFSESEQRIAANALRLHGLSYSFTDLVTGQTIALDSDLVLEAYRFVWLTDA